MRAASAARLARRTSTLPRRNRAASTGGWPRPASSRFRSAGPGPAARGTASAEGKDLVEHAAGGPARRLDAEDLGERRGHVVDGDLAPVDPGADARPHEDHRDVGVVAEDAAVSGS